MTFIFYKNVKETRSRFIQYSYKINRTMDNNKRNTYIFLMKILLKNVYWKKYHKNIEKKDNLTIGTIFRYYEL